MYAGQAWGRLDAGKPAMSQYICISHINAYFVLRNKHGFHLRSPHKIIQIVPIVTFTVHKGAIRSVITFVQLLLCVDIT